MGGSPVPGPTAQVSGPPTIWHEHCYTSQVSSMLTCAARHSEGCTELCISEHVCKRLEAQPHPSGSRGRNAAPLLHWVLPSGDVPPFHFVAGPKACAETQGHNSSMPLCSTGLSWQVLESGTPIAVASGLRLSRSTYTYRRTLTGAVIQNLLDTLAAPCLERDSGCASAADKKAVP